MVLYEILRDEKRTWNSNDFFIQVNNCFLPICDKRSYGGRGGGGGARRADNLSPKSVCMSTPKLDTS